ncbi:transcriptional regulator family: Fungal Specific TF [Purpureocillium lilacinum]|uniref:Transcriptional regulator family: Fungal Specific TF n=1 Tax=Purpureocillium lilacinum TaxID=33203 RepID=A0ABR0BFS0_PURLI|nr:transcriptional regulator family: Fungal Specific TF [Purpureocillium lilacinum]
MLQSRHHATEAASPQPTVTLAPNGAEGFPAHGAEVAGHTEPFGPGVLSVSRKENPGNVEFRVTVNNLTGLRHRLTRTMVSSALDTPAAESAAKSRSSVSRTYDPEVTTVCDLKEAQKRIQWLESEIRKETGAACTTLPTGTDLTNLWPRRDSRASRCLGPATSPAVSQPVSLSESIEVPGPGTLNVQYFPAGNDDSGSEISLLALNATGEERYLGPSSGALFANYAIALMRSCSLSQDTWRRRPEQGGVIRESAFLADDPHPLPTDEVRLLLQSYIMWVHPLYPLLELEVLDSLITRCSALQVSGDGQSQRQDMSMFYLVMALGATNRANTVKQLQLHLADPHSDIFDKDPSPCDLYSVAVQYFQLSPEHLRPSVRFIQIILLICIYSSYRPIGSSQWQLAGLAMRAAVEMGLHYAPKSEPASSSGMNVRSRVFWTAYAMEISLAYNLGRPPSICEEHITTGLPIVDSAVFSSALHHIKHRRIQSRIVARVYYGGRAETESEECQHLIANLQSELDEWRKALQNLCLPDTDTPYPHSYWDRLYHGTTFVLHRASPLCPHPSDESLECCVRSAGAYIDSMAEVLSASNVPLSWMLIQGVLFAGLTMLVTAWTCHQRLAARAGLGFLLVDLPAWSRKCSVCFAIVNERWNEDLLSKLDSQFELLTNNTLGVISTALMSHAAATGGTYHDQAQSTIHFDGHLVPGTAQPAATLPDGSWNGPIDHLGMNASTFPNIGTAALGESFDSFCEVLGIDGAETFGMSSVSR